MNADLVADSATMLRRSLLHIVRYPSMTFMLIGQPVLFLLLFVYVFGGAMTTGAGGTTGAAPDRTAYLTYVVPGILALTIASVAISTSILVAMDRTEGFIDRVRTMAVARPALLAGHVLAALVQTLVAVVVLLGVCVALGFRPQAGPGDWLGLAGLLIAVTFGVTWLCVALGLVSDSVETASNLPMPLMMLPMLGSAFVPPATMPGPLRVFAEHQPFTPLGEAIRGFLHGSVVASDVVAALSWFTAIGVAGFVWSLALFRTRKAR